MNFDSKAAGTGAGSRLNRQEQQSRSVSPPSLLIPMSTVAISYARFSSAPQAQGASLSRQVERAREYAEANSLVLDPTLCFEDPGVSAWDQSNLEKGALGGFLRAVDEGKVPKGATLIVESFDRLSRATPLDALPVFLRIIGAGLNLAILTNPPQLFSRATLKESG
ncbi:recombinase family protein [Paucibacter sediminis]|uniref:Recombinase family protein n=1 Tax=Paucibacter sediminis TaxID=3019553 RepID=A0AA95N9Q5_9BURK|nr:recombinase family protein [Paucibacter sp. S2-9]WIT11007.1 recombinase family protein [Paucibacter sp. S2-9]